MVQGREWQALEGLPDRDGVNKVFFGDCRESMRQMIADGIKAQMCVTSPPYFGLRDYGHPEQLGLESTPTEYVANMVEVFRLVRDVIADDGVLWLNLGDSYTGSANNGSDTSKTMQGTQAATGKSLPSKGGAGLKPKDLIGIPWRVAFALQSDGWYLRQDIIWHKPNPMPESVTDRCTKAHEYIFLMAKSERYYYDAAAIAEDADAKYESRYSAPFNVGDKEAGGAGRPGAAANTAGMKEYLGKRNKRSVWTISTKPYSGAHFATFPPDLIEPCILAGSRPGDIVLDPFFGSGTTGQVSQALGRKWIGCELNNAYGALQNERTAQQSMELI